MTVANGRHRRNALASIAYALAMLSKVNLNHSRSDELTANSIFEAIHERFQVIRKTRSVLDTAIVSDVGATFSLNSLSYAFNDSDIRKAVQTAYPNRIEFVRRGGTKKSWKVTIDPDLVTTFGSKDLVPIITSIKSKLSNVIKPVVTNQRRLSLRRTRTSESIANVIGMQNATNNNYSATTNANTDELEDSSSKYKLQRMLNLKYKVRTLEKENLIMKRKLAEFEEKERTSENLKRRRLYVKKHREKKKRTFIADDESSSCNSPLHPTRLRMNSSTNTASDYLMAAVKCGRVFKKAKTNTCNQEELSPLAAYQFLDMNSTGNVPLRQIPHVIGCTLSALFGPLTEECWNYLTPSESAVSLAVDKAAQLESMETAGILETCNGMYLGIDEANKGRAYQCKLVTYKLLYDNLVEMTGLKLDHSRSKKPAQSAEQIFDSLVKQLGRETPCKIIGGITDWAHDGLTLKIVMKKIDELAANCPDVASVTLISQRIPGRTFDIRGKFRELLVFGCKAHHIDTAFGTLLDDLAGQAGLNHETTTLQQMYTLAYYLDDDKLRSPFQYWLQTLYAGVQIPKPLLKLIGKVAANRWLSREDTASRIVELLKHPLPMSNYVVGILNDIEGRLGRDKWIEWKRQFSCFCDVSDNISAYMFTVYMLLRHAPGGLESHTKKKLKELLGFLGSAEHRIAMLLMSEFLPLHKKYLAFINGPSKVVSSNIFGTRLLESPVFMRNVLREVSDIKHDWRNGLNVRTDLSDMLEILYSQTTYVANDSIDCISYWDSKMKQSIDDMFEKFNKYFCHSELHIGRCIPYLIDPIMSTHIARGMLRACYELKVYDNTDADPIDLTPEISDVELNIPWTVDNPIHAYPNGMTYSQVENTIHQSFMKNRDQSIDFINALDLRICKDELKALAQGSLRDIVEADCNLAWQPGHPVETYCHLFIANFPNIYDTLETIYGIGCMGTTHVECAFSNLTNLSNANDSADAVANKMQHQLTVRSPITRALTKDGIVQTPRRGTHQQTRSRHLASKKSRFYYSKSLLLWAKASSEKFWKRVSSRRRLRGNKGKTRKHFEESITYIEKEGATNVMPQQETKTLTAIIEKGAQMDEVKRAHLLTFPKGVTDIFKERMKREKLINKDHIIDYLHRNAGIPIADLKKLNVSKLDEHDDPWHSEMPPRTLHEHVLQFWSVGNPEQNTNIL